MDKIITRPFGGQIIKFDFNKGKILGPDGSYKWFRTVLKFWEILNSLEEQDVSSPDIPKSLRFSTHDMHIPGGLNGCKFVDNTSIKFGCTTGTYGQISEIVKVINENNK